LNLSSNQITSLSRLVHTVTYRAELYESALVLPRAEGPLVRRDCPQRAGLMTAPWT